MIYSMTAFARQSLLQDNAVLVWEIRSVNHRYLEPHFKLPDAVRMLEPELRETLRNAVSRGKIECNLHLQTTAHAGASKLVINQSLLQQLLTAGEAVQQQLQQPAAINLFDALNWPGVITEIHDGSDSVNKQILALFNTALKQLIETREREGTVLKAYIEQRLTTITRITTAVRQQLPLILQAQRQKLQERLQELKAQLNTERLEQEIVILVQKADVDEELDRLDTHVNEVHRILDKGGVCGRRLDFLMQELNREANTLSSKSIVSDTTQAAVELKVLIEQMREQIQNIE